MTQMFKPPASAPTHMRRQAYANYDRATVDTILDSGLLAHVGYVVDGGTTDGTYQYNTGGTALGNNTLSGGDTAPRGEGCWAPSARARSGVWPVELNNRSQRVTPPEVTHARRP